MGDGSYGEGNPSLLRATLMNHNSLQSFLWNPSSSCKDIPTEFMDQGSLRDIISRGVLDVFMTWDISYDILMGLQFLHSLQFVHREIKPANILVSSHGIGFKAKIAGNYDVLALPYQPILDFGTVRDLARGGTLTSSVGTPKCRHS